MKNLISTLLITTAVVPSFGQYVFNTSSDPYQVLAAPLSVNNGTAWNNSSSFVVAFNFDFNILGQTFTALNVMAGGGLAFPGLGDQELRVFGHPDSGYLLEDRDQVNSASPISYEVTGNVGHRILKVQWENAGFREFCASSDPDDYVNFQIWLFEVDDHIEVHFGDYLADAGAYGQPDCNSGTDGTQFIFRFDACTNALSLTGPAMLPSYDFRNHCVWQPGIHVSGTPSSGTVYNLIPGNIGMDDASATAMRIYPQPSSGILHLDGLPANTIRSIEITDLHGRACLVEPHPLSMGNELSFDLSELSNGVYTLRLMVEGGSPIARRIIRSE